MSLSFDPASVRLPVGHFIDGRVVPGAAALEVRAPSDGRMLADIPCADADVVDRAVGGARAALDASGWGGVRPRERLRALSAWADLIEADTEGLARAEAVSSSRLIAEAGEDDVATSAEQIRFFAEFADKEGGDLAPTDAGHLGLIADEPYGVVGAITPWNYPIAMAAWKLAPALAAGNAVVLKPSELTPFSTVLLAELAVKAGLPAGLVNVVLGSGPVTGAALAAHPGVGKVTFTGSTRAGGEIMANIARAGIKPMTLELGGKSPQVVFGDADLERAAGAIFRSITGNSGQNCVAGSRLIVERGVMEELVAKITARMRTLRPGPTWDEASRYSPVISENQLRRIEGIVAAAREQGAEILCGGARFPEDRHFYQPTVLTSVAPDSPAIREEIFGPVLTVQPFDDEEEAVALARHPTYGLCAGLHARDVGRVFRVMRRLEAGTVWINRYGRSSDHILPTGGWQASGLGKDLGREAYRANRRSKTVLLAL